VVHHRGATDNGIRPHAWADAETHTRKPFVKEIAMTDQFFNAPLAEVDPEIAQVLERELERQRGYLEMIASENFVPVSVLQSQGSVLTNKYAEGYPGRRYYCGCEEVDDA
jgi:hypothetical protein